MMSGFRQTGIVRAGMLVAGLLFISVFIWGALVWVAVLSFPNIGINPLVREDMFAAYVLILAVVVLLISFGLYSWLLGKRLGKHIITGG